MISPSRITVLLGLIGICLPVAYSSPYVISDDRVRSVDITPVLGRGYSIMTNSFQSTCLMVDQTTVPSYNYEYSFYEFSDSETTSDTITSTMSGKSGCFFCSKTRWSQTTSETTKTESTSHMIVAVMSLQRYYSSVREEVSPLSDDAYILLDREDYVGFFKACGPNYVRGIRRSQEITGIMTFKSSSQSKANSFFRSVRRGSSGFGSSRSSSNSEIEETLEISIHGSGLGLGVQGSETLVATSIQEFENVMKFAFRAMTQSRDSHHIGMVHGIEIVPWVDNAAYQVASKLQDEVIEIPLPRSLIPKSFHTDLSIDTPYSTADRGNYRCKLLSDKIDKYGYCCEIGALFDFTSNAYDTDSPETKVCKPLRTLEKSIVKNNLASNGEFVARLDRAVRFKINQLATLERCISAATSVPDSFNYNILSRQDSVAYDSTVNIDVTLIELKVAVDPFNDYSLVKQLGKELDEYVDMFYQPCLAALFGSKIGDSSDTEPTYFMAYPWHTHDECTLLSCLGTSMRWSREAGGGCVPSIIAGVKSQSYGDDSTCSKNLDKAGNEEECKHKTEDLETFRRNAAKCMNDNLGNYRVDFFMNNYCMPNVSTETKSQSLVKAIACNATAPP
jgi:hypothetical protein